MLRIRRMIKKIKLINAMFADLQPMYIKLITTALKYTVDDYVTDIDPANDINGEDRHVIDDYLSDVQIIVNKLSPYYNLPDEIEYPDESGFESMRYIAKNVRNVERKIMKLEWVCCKMMVVAIRYERSCDYVAQVNPNIDKWLSHAHNIGLIVRHLCDVDDWGDYVRDENMLSRT